MKTSGWRTGNLKRFHTVSVCVSHSRVRRCTWREHTTCKRAHLLILTLRALIRPNQNPCAAFIWLCKPHAQKGIWRKVRTRGILSCPPPPSLNVTGHALKTPCGHKDQECDGLFALSLHEGAAVVSHSHGCICMELVDVEQMFTPSRFQLSGLANVHNMLKSRLIGESRYRGTISCLFLDVAILTFHCK